MFETKIRTHRTFKNMLIDFKNMLKDYSSKEIK